MEMTQHPLDTLSFVERRPDGTRDYWAVPRSGNYSTDCATGRIAAIELANQIRETDNPTLLGSVVAAMIAGGEYDGVEIGFCGEIASTLIVLSR